MTAEEHKQAIKELTLIPGVGRDIADDLIEMGITRVGQLKNKDPEKLYSKSNREKGVVQDKLVLYTFRCAVYFASNEKHEEEKLKAKYWKDK